MEELVALQWLSAAVAHAETVTASLQEAAAQAGPAWPDVVMALFTAGLFFVGAAYACLTHKMVREMRVLREPDVYVEFGAGATRDRYRMMVINRGGSAAHNIQFTEALPMFATRRGVQGQDFDCTIESNITECGIDYLIPGQVADCGASFAVCPAPGGDQESREWQSILDWEPLWGTSRIALALRYDTADKCGVEKRMTINLIALESM